MSLRNELARDMLIGRVIDALPNLDFEATHNILKLVDYYQGKTMVKVIENDA